MPFGLNEELGSPLVMFFLSSLVFLYTFFIKRIKIAVPKNFQHRYQELIERFEHHSKVARIFWTFSVFWLLQSFIEYFYKNG